MKTDELIGLLATQVEPVAPVRAGGRVARWAALGLLGAALIMLPFYGLRPDLGVVMGLPMFWLKLGVPLLLALAGWLLVERLGRPGVAAGGGWWLALLPVVVLWVMGLVQWTSATGAERPALLWGSTWRTCLWSIGLIGAPVFVAALLALRQLAPTQPRWAGAAAGLLAGGAGAAVYALHCPELTAPFLAVWYVLGMAVPVALGAWLGPRLLRW